MTTATKNYQQRHDAFYGNLSYGQRLRAFACQAAKLIMRQDRGQQDTDLNLALVIALVKADCGNDEQRCEAEAQLTAMPEPQNPKTRLAVKAVLAALNPDAKAGAIEGCALFAEYNGVSRPDEAGWENVPHWEPSYTFWELAQEALNSDGIK